MAAQGSPTLGTDDQTIEAPRNCLERNRNPDGSYPHLGKKGTHERQSTHSEHSDHVLGSYPAAATYRTYRQELLDSFENVKPIDRCSCI